MDLGLFEGVSQACLTMVPAELGEMRVSWHRYGMKAWFGTERPGREHYEAQVVGAWHVPTATMLAIEVGFHAEHPDGARNDVVIDRLCRAESRWRPLVGTEAEVAPFLGRPEDWRRVSEVWIDPDLGDPDLPIELAARLTDYVTALEPVLRAAGDRPD